MPLFGMGRRVARRTARRTSRRQGAMSSDQGGGQEEYYEEPAAAAPAEPDPMEQLQKLAQLHEQGILTDEEFAAQKAKILG
jgi:Short C-terminal domain